VAGRDGFDGTTGALRRGVFGVSSPRVGGRPASPASDGEGPRLEVLFGEAHASQADIVTVLKVSQLSHCHIPPPNQTLPRGKCELTPFPATVWPMTGRRNQQFSVSTQPMTSLSSWAMAGSGRACGLSHSIVPGTTQGRSLVPTHDVRGG
jgi:hypothetical protein